MPPFFKSPFRIPLRSLPFSTGKWCAFGSRFFLMSLCLWASIGVAVGQDSLTLELRFGQVSNFEKNIKYRKTHPNLASVERELSKILPALHEQSYLAARADSFSQKGKQIIVFLNPGPSYEWVQWSEGNVPKEILERVGFRLNDFKGKKINYRAVAKLERQLLDEYLNNGFPLAKVWLEIPDTILPEGKLDARLMVESGTLYLWESLSCEFQEPGDNAQKQLVTAKFLCDYLGIRKGQPYSDELLRRLPTRMRELPFIEMAGDLELSLVNGAVFLRLPVKRKSASRFDGLLGILPSNNASGRSELNLTGNLNLDLQNLFNRGARFRLEWQQLQAGTQDLKVKTTYPYLFRTPLGVDASFWLYKRDTLYLDTRWDIGVQYIFSAGHTLKIFVEQHNTALLSVNTASLLTSKTLPTSLPIQTNSFGLEYARADLDYRFNPRKGRNLWLKGRVGFKEIFRDRRINDQELNGFKYSTLFDTVQLTSSQYRLELLVEQYFPIASRATLKLGLQAGSVLGSARLYRNELFRIGGNKILRGFNEESIPVSSYGVGTLEGRYLFGRNSFAFIFGDVAYFENKSQDTDQRSLAIGTGVGAAFETRIGIFSLTYALGARDGQELDTRTGKVHFGYLNLF